jgi:histidine triad (HIT) family protein
MSTTRDCIFCAIATGTAPASVIYEDETVMAFMGLRPIHPGECMVIPKAHVDHFTDLDDELAQRIMVTAQRIGRRMREVFSPRRVGMVVHGFGVPHAHLLLIPQHKPTDITSDRFASIRGSEVIFGVEQVPLVDRSVLDEQARLLALAADTPVEPTAAEGEIGTTANDVGVCGS